MGYRLQSLNDTDGRDVPRFAPYTTAELSAREGKEAGRSCQKRRLLAILFPASGVSRPLIAGSGNRALETLRCHEPRSMCERYRSKWMSPLAVRRPRCC
jgi:hypothetical protein